MVAVLLIETREHAAHVGPLALASTQAARNPILT
jgi:hypothetical protein